MDFGFGVRLFYLFLRFIFVSGRVVGVGFIRVVRVLVIGIN